LTDELSKAGVDEEARGEHKSKGSCKGKVGRSRARIIRVLCGELFIIVSCMCEVTRSRSLMIAPMELVVG
jgi:hypothetical protein